jgi:putative NADPH-quinone reductase
MRLLERGHAVPRILLVNGHPDPRPERFCAALCDAYLQGARAAGHCIEAIAFGSLPIDDEPRQESLGNLDALKMLRECDKLVAVFPLWLDKPPPLLTWFFELGACDADEAAARSARLIVTMAMPAFIHRSLRRARGSVAEGISLPGWQTSTIDLVGCVHALSPEQREDWLVRLRQEGRKGA